MYTTQRSDCFVAARNEYFQSLLVFSNQFSDFRISEILPQVVIKIILNTTFNSGADTDTVYHTTLWAHRNHLWDVSNSVTHTSANT